MLSKETLRFLPPVKVHIVSLPFDNAVDDYPRKNLTDSNSNLGIERITKILKAINLS
jgi:hypothetical protein